jgi:hypothetical protein
MLKPDHLKIFRTYSAAKRNAQGMPILRVGSDYLVGLPNIKNAAALFEIALINSKGGSPAASRFVT